MLLFLRAVGGIIYGIRYFYKRIMLGCNCDRKRIYDKRKRLYKELFKGNR